MKMYMLEIQVEYTASSDYPHFPINERDFRLSVLSNVTYGFDLRPLCNIFIVLFFQLGTENYQFQKIYST